jgi:chorismate-pyruvate lyase
MEPIPPSLSSDDSKQAVPQVPRASVSLPSLVAIYYSNPSELGTFQRVTHDQTPQVYRELLSHTSHMTVTVEQFHNDSVDVTVLRSGASKWEYCREILLKTHRAQRVVQYGIVRLHLPYVPEAPRAEILGEAKPLGRVLIEHNVLREIELADLFEVTCGPALARFFHTHVGAITYGRTAWLHCNNEPAIELLEIVAPEG